MSRTKTNILSNRKRVAQRIGRASGLPVAQGFKDLGIWQNFNTKRTQGDRTKEARKRIHRIGKTGIRPEAKARAVQASANATGWFGVAVNKVQKLKLKKLNSAAARAIAGGTGRASTEMIFARQKFWRCCPGAYNCIMPIRIR